MENGVLHGNPVHMPFWPTLWTLLKRRRTYLNVFVVPDDQGGFFIMPCMGPYEWPKEKWPKVGDKPEECA